MAKQRKSKVSAKEVHRRASRGIATKVKSSTGDKINYGDTSAEAQRKWDPKYAKKFAEQGGVDAFRKREAKRAGASGYKSQSGNYIEVRKHIRRGRPVVHYKRTRPGGVKDGRVYTPRNKPGPGGMVRAKPGESWDPYALSSKPPVRTRKTKAGSVHKRSKRAGRSY